MRPIVTNVGNVATHVCVLGISVRSVASFQTMIGGPFQKICGLNVVLVHFGASELNKLNILQRGCAEIHFEIFGIHRSIYNVDRKKRGSTFDIITLEKHARFL